MHAAQDTVSPSGKDAKPLIEVRNETFGGSSQILQTSRHKKRASIAQKALTVIKLYMHICPPQNEN